MRFLALPLLLLATPLLAEPVTLSLSEAQKEELVAGNMAADLADLRGVPMAGDRRPHGELGVMVGSGGTRGIYGVTSVPLGENGAATLGFESSRNVWRGPY